MHTCLVLTCLFQDIVDIAGNEVAEDEDRRDVEQEEMLASCWH